MHLTRAVCTDICYKRYNMLYGHSMGTPCCHYVWPGLAVVFAAADLNSHERLQKGHRCSVWAESHFVMHCR